MTQLSEDAEPVNTLVSLLYPIAPVVPSSYEEAFALLAACQKYDMASIRSSIRKEVIRGTFLRQLGMTFAPLGEALRTCKGRVLCNPSSRS